MTASQLYTPHPRYKFIAGLCLLLAALFAWNLLRVAALGDMFFLMLSLGIALWNSSYLVYSQVQLTPTGVCVSIPLRPRQCVEFRQLVSVSENGRLNPVITLVYHPQLANGLLDLDTVHSLILPAVTAQADLLAHLQARMPT